MLYVFSFMNFFNRILTSAGHQDVHQNDIRLRLFNYINNIITMLNHFNIVFLTKNNITSLKYGLVIIANQNTFFPLHKIIRLLCGSKCKIENIFNLLSLLVKIKRVKKQNKLLQRLPDS